MEYIEVTKEEAKAAYCKCEKIYVSTDKREMWKIPASYEYGSHAPMEELFYRGIPEYEGEVRFFKIDTRKRTWICYYINSKGNEMQKIFHNLQDGLTFTQLLDKRITRGTCGGYSFMEV